MNFMEYGLTLSRVIVKKINSFFKKKIENNNYCTSYKNNYSKIKIQNVHKPYLDLMRLK
jgi:hypothetical protein